MYLVLLTEPKVSIYFSLTESKAYVYVESLSGDPNC